MTEDDVYAELGEIVNGSKVRSVGGDILVYFILPFLLQPGREGDELIVVDLTGTGAQDAAIGQVAWDKMSKL